MVLVFIISKNLTIVLNLIYFVERYIKTLLQRARYRAKPLVGDPVYIWICYVCVCLKFCQHIYREKRMCPVECERRDSFGIITI